jgi:hypothetical protein
VTEESFEDDETTTVEVINYCEGKSCIFQRHERRKGELSTNIRKTSQEGTKKEKDDGKKAIQFV